MLKRRSVLIWISLILVLAAPIAAAAMSPLLAWRDPIYIAAGFAGVVGLALLVVQPLLVLGYLPGLGARRGRRMHRWIGGSLILTVVVHVAGLWLTSPPDVMDALLFASPTPFSVWGVIAMWALFAAAGLAMVRHRLRLRIWRTGHSALAAVIVLGTVIHAALIEGTMETTTKAALCILALAITTKVLFNLRLLWSNRAKQR